MMGGFQLLSSLFMANLCFPGLADTWPSPNFPSHPDTGDLLLTRVLDVEVSERTTFPHEPRLFRFTEVRMF